MHKCIFMVQLDACSLLFENNNSQVNYLKRRFHLKRGSILAILALFSLFFHHPAALHAYFQCSHGECYWPQHL